MKTVILITALFLIASFLLAENVNEGTLEILSGIWVNQEYKTFGGKYTFNSDGTGFLFKKASDKDPVYECRIIIEERWTDKDGNTYYKALLLFDTTPYDKPIRREPWLIKLNPSGDVLEKATYGAGYLGYPEEVNPNAGGAYSIHYRQ